MRAYEITKGTTSILLKNQKDATGLNDGHWDSIPFRTSHELMFSGEDMLIDPVRVHNGNVEVNTHSTIYKLAERGYMVFSVDHTKQQKFLLAVPYSSVNIG